MKPNAGEESLGQLDVRTTIITGAAPYLLSEGTRYIAESEHVIDGGNTVGG